MYASTVVLRKPPYHPELEDPTKKIDLRVLEEHLRRSKRTMIIETLVEPTLVEPELERTTLQFRACPVYPIQRRRFPMVSVVVALMILAVAATWLRMM
jgi:hypothetical protein